MTGNRIAVHRYRLGQFVDTNNHRCYGRRLGRFADPPRRRRGKALRYPMMSRCCILGPLAAAITTAAATAAPPPRITHLADAATLAQRDRSDIREYAEFWCAELKNQDPMAVDTAREKLADPLVRPVRVSEVFRFAYADAVLPHLTQILDDDSTQAGVIAVQIAAELGTPQALDTITDHASVDDEKDFGIRLWAAKGFPIAVGQKALTPNEIDRAVRLLGDAASKEPNWLVLRRQFEAIASVGGGASRDEQVRVLRATTDRMVNQEGPCDLMQAAYPALKLMLDEYLRLDPPQQRTFGKDLAPVLMDLVTVANNHWDSAQKDDVARVVYGGAINISENLLRLIDGTVRPSSAGPSTELGPAWHNRQKSRFTDDREKWLAVVSGPPYSNR
jgi:hypothetical protein